MSTTPKLLECTTVDSSSTKETSIPLVVLIEYLRSAPVVYVSRPAPLPGLPPTEARPASVAWFSDGSWVWSATLVANVSSGTCSLPEEFLRSVRPGLRIDPTPAELEAAAQVAKSATPVSTSNLVSFHVSATSSQLLDLLVLGSTSPNRAEFSDAWYRLRDGVAANSLPDLLKRLLTQLITKLPNQTPSRSVREAIATRRLLFPTGPEIIDEVLRWTYGEPIDSLLDEATRMFYGLVLACALYGLLREHGVDPGLDSVFS